MTIEENKGKNKMRKTKITKHRENKIKREKEGSREVQWGKEPDEEMETLGRKSKSDTKLMQPLFNKFLKASAFSSMK